MYLLSFKSRHSFLFSVSLSSANISWLKYLPLQSLSLIGKISDYYIFKKAYHCLLLNFSIGIVKGKVEGFEIPRRRKQSTIIAGT